MSELYIEMQNTKEYNYNFKMFKGFQCQLTYKYDFEESLIKRVVLHNNI